MTHTHDISCQYTLHSFLSVSKKYETYVSFALSIHTHYMKIYIFWGVRVKYITLINVRDISLNTFYFLSFGGNSRLDIQTLSNQWQPWLDLLFALIRHNLYSSLRFEFTLVRVSFVICLYFDDKSHQQIRMSHIFLKLIKKEWSVYWQLILCIFSSNERMCVYWQCKGYVCLVFFETDKKEWSEYWQC